MTRAYDMTARGRVADGTRQRIIDAAHALLGRADGGMLTLQEVADAAGISRPTIYNRIGARSDLLVAVFEDQGRLTRFDRVLDAMQLEDVRDAIVETVRESCRAWSVIPLAIRRTLALAVVDEEVGRLTARFEGYRRREIAKLAARARAEGAITSNASLPVVAATLSLLTSFEAFDHLRRTHSPEAATRQLVRIARDALGLDRGARGRVRPPFRAP
jgi:AcrR family transcriptional regulator